MKGLTLWAEGAGSNSSLLELVKVSTVGVVNAETGDGEDVFKEPCEEGAEI